MDTTLQLIRAKSNDGVPESRGPFLTILQWLRRVWTFSVGVPETKAVARDLCHRITLDAKGVPRRLLQSSISLQLEHLIGQSFSGFAWRQLGTVVEVWYWIGSPRDMPEGGILPCPEPLLREDLTCGLHLIQCIVGYEAVCIRNGGLTHRTRWFKEIPSEAHWQQFVRDSGFDPEQHRLPRPQSMALRRRPSNHWVLFSTALKPIGLGQRMAWAMVALTGAVLIGLATYHAKLVFFTTSLENEYVTLAAQSATTLKLQQHIDALRLPIATVLLARPQASQAKLMAALARAGLFDESKKVNLQDWEYRNEQIRIQFSVPSDGFELGKFLESIEQLRLFKNIRLLPGTPPQSVGLQAELLTPLRGTP